MGHIKRRRRTPCARRRRRKRRVGVRSQVGGFTRLIAHALRERYKRNNRRKKL